MLGELKFKENDCIQIFMLSPAQRDVVLELCELVHYGIGTNFVVDRSVDH